MVSLHHSENTFSGVPTKFPRKPATALRIRKMLHNLHHDASSGNEEIYTQLIAEWRAAGREIPDAHSSSMNSSVLSSEKIERFVSDRPDAPEQEARP